MDVVLGSGPLATAIASQLGPQGPTALVSDIPTDGPFLWRRAVLHTGEGVPAAIRLVTRAWWVIGDDDDPTAMLSMLKPASLPRAVIVLSPGDRHDEAFRRFPHWSTLRLGPVLGPEHPWIAAWRAQIAAGSTAWIPDVGQLRVVATADAARAAVAANQHAGVRWTLAPTHTLRLPDLGPDLATLGPGSVRTRPLALAAWRTGQPAAAIRALSQPGAVATVTGGWSAPAPGPLRVLVGDRVRTTNDAERVDESSSIR